MQASSSVIGIRPQLLFILLFLLIPLFTTGCATIKGVSMLRGGSTEQGVLLRDELVRADHVDHLLTVKARINGSPEELNFFVDTGAITIIDEQTAKRFSFKDKVNFDIKDAADNKKEINLVQINQLSVGNISVSDCAAAIIDLKKFSPKIDGVLGSNFMKYFKVQLDYQNSSLTFMSNSSVSQPLADSIAIPMWKNMKFGFAPTMKCELDAVVTVDCIVDTGHDAIASIPLSFIRKLPHFQSGEFVSSIGAIGGGGFGKNKKTSYLTKVDKVTTGPLIINNVPALSNNGDIMTLGSPFLRNFLIVIDYPNSMLYLKPYSNAKNDNKMPSFGFDFSKEKDKAIVTGIWKGSAADKSGLLVGDELISINGQKTTILSFFDIRELMSSSNSLNITYIKKFGNSADIILDKTDLTLLFSTSPN